MPMIILCWEREVLRFGVTDWIQNTTAGGFNIVKVASNQVFKGAENHTIDLITL